MSGSITYLGNPHDARVWDEVSEELERATAEYGSFHSGHEGWAVIQEEVEELWDEIKANRGTTRSAKHEAIQVAAMAIRYVVDICDDE